MKNNKQYDVYMDGGKALVFPRGEVDKYGDLPEGKPLYETDVEGDWYDWCNDRADSYDEQAIRVCKAIGKYDAKFVADLERKAQETFDTYREEGAEQGWGELTIDHTGMHYTYRASANWKNEPMRYTFDQPFKWTQADKMDFADRIQLWARDNLVRLHGMADAAYELGLTLTFDTDFKVKVMGLDVMWDCHFEC